MYIQKNNSTVVSIVVPTCNRASLLQKMTESVLMQSFSDWELLAIDDVSTDDTETIMRNYCSKDSRIKYFRIPADNTKGIYKYLNYGMNTAQGKYISRLDDDDYWYDKDTLKLQVEFLENNPEYVLVGGGVIIVDENYKEVFRYLKNENDKEIRKNALISNPFAHNTVMFIKEKALSIGGYANLTFAEDWDLWLRLGKIGKFYNFQKHFTCYLSAGQNTSFKFQKQQTKTLSLLLKRYKNDYPGFNLGYSLNFLQYLYSFLPVFIKKRFHNVLIYFKRNYF